MIIVRLLGATEGAASSLRPRARAMVAALALQRRAYVGSERLAKLIWPHPPASYRSNLRTYATQIRRVLREHGPGANLHTQRGGDGGYVLQVADDQVDAGVFVAAHREGLAQLAAGDVDAGVASLHRALGLWRGVCGEDLPPVGALQDDLDAFDYERDQATLDLAEAMIIGTDPRPAVALVRLVTRRHPFADRPVEVLMRAHYRVGDSAAALSAFREHSRMLRDQMGHDPSPDLRRLYQSILRHDAL